MANNIVATWGFKRKLPEPFEDYTDHAIFDDIASKYCTQPRKKSTLHAATLRAVLAYLELENPVGSTPPEKLGAVGTQSNNFVVAEYPSKTGDLQVVVYNQLNGKFYRWLLWHEGADFLGAVLHGLRGYPGSGPLHGACLCLCRC